VDCCRRFDCGGETSLLFELGRLPKAGRWAILKVLASDANSMERWVVERRLLLLQNIEVVRLHLPPKSRNAISRKHVLTLSCPLPAPRLAPAGDTKTILAILWQKLFHIWQQVHVSSSTFSATRIAAVLCLHVPRYTLCGVYILSIGSHYRTLRIQRESSIKFLAVVCRWYMALDRDDEISDTKYKCRL